MNNIAVPSWKELLTNPAPDGHFVQLYQDADFQGEAVSHFAAAGLAWGESIIIVATRPNWDNISARLAHKGLDVASLLLRGQLTLLDADQTLPKFMVDSMPDARTFKSFAHATIERARGGARHSRVRWWGEMVNVLYINGNGRGSTRLEELFGEVGREAAVPMFCSFLMDKYDAKIYEGPFGDLCRTHSHVIPSEDYTVHLSAIDTAIAEVLGPIAGALLESFISWKETAGASMPFSQQFLLWVKDVVPEKFEDVLAFARKYEEGYLREADRESA